MRYTFKVYERLKREQHIHTLFLTGKAYSVFPVRLIYKLVTRPEGKASAVLAGFSVPKKKFKSSVHRHRIRRLMVEAWRLNKHLVAGSIPADKQLHLFFIFTDKVMPEQEPVQQALVKGISQLAAILNSTPRPAHD